MGGARTRRSGSAGRAVLAEAPGEGAHGELLHSQAWAVPAGQGLVSFDTVTGATRGWDNLLWGPGRPAKGHPPPHHPDLGLGLWERWAPQADSLGGLGVQGQLASLFVLLAAQVPSVVSRGSQVPTTKVPRVWGEGRPSSAAGGLAGRPGAGRGMPPRREHGHGGLGWRGDAGVAAQ